MDLLEMLSAKEKVNFILLKNLKSCLTNLNRSDHDHPDFE